ncbi:hypothetical protein [Deinococcus sp. UYEF24]
MAVGVHQTFSWPWFKDKCFTLLRIFVRFGIVNWVLFIGCLVAAGEAYAEYRAIAKPTTWEVVSVYGKTLVALIPALVLILSARNTDNYKTGLRKGRDDTTREWGLAVRGQIVAVKHIAELLDLPRGRRDANALLAVQNLMVSTRKIVTSVFDGVSEDSLTVSIGVPNASRSEMRIVELTPEIGLRKSGNCYRVDPDPQQHHSMIRALASGKPNNTPDAQRHQDLVDKTYRSILSFPIVDNGGHIVAVLNIDAPEIALFGDAVAIGSDTSAAKVAYELSQPNLKSLALAITQAELYKGYRNS